MASQRKKFTIYQEPHVAEVGDYEFKFRPEIYADESLDAFLTFRQELDDIREKYGSETDGDGNLAVPDPEVVKARNTEVNAANRRFVAAHMTEDSREEYLTARLPERINLELQRWVTEVYGQRPTTSSSGS